MNKQLLWNLVNCLLIVAMFLLQYAPTLEPFKYWICFVIMLASVASIVFNTFLIVSSLSKTKKRVAELEKAIATNTEIKE